MSEQLDDEISFLDIAVFLAEHWIALLFGPIVVGAIAYFITIALPTSYSASISVSPPRVQIENVNVVDSQALYHLARQPREHITASERNGVITIAATGSSPQEARSRVLSAHREIVGPILENIEARREGLMPVRDRMETAKRELAGRDDIESVLALAQLLIGAAPVEDRIAALDSAYAGMSAAPDIQNRRVGQRPVLVALLAAVATFFVLVIIFGARRAVSSAMRDEASSEKIGRIRAAFLGQRN